MKTKQRNVNSKKKKDASPDKKRKDASKEKRSVRNELNKQFKWRV